MSGEAQKESVKSLRITQNKDEAITPEQVLWKEESINAIQTLFVKVIAAVQGENISPPRDNTSTALPPALIAQLVARVAMEASKQLQPSIAPPLSQQSEVLLISSTFSLQVTVQVPVGMSVLYGPGYIPPLGDNSLGVVARVPESTPLDSLVKSGSSISFPRAYCLKFYGGVDCAGRSFKHSCPTFEGPHRAFNCNFCAFGRSTGHSLGLEEPVSPPGGQRACPRALHPQIVKICSYF